MYTKYNLKDIDATRKTLKEIDLSSTLRQDYYSSNFYTHLSELMVYHLMFAEKGTKIKMTKNGYLELGQFVLESNFNSYDNEPEIDWEYILKAKDILEDHLKLKLGKERKSLELKPFINSTLDAFESQLLFLYTHKEASFNPWDSVHNILGRNGCLHFITDNEDMFKYYEPKLTEKRTGELKSNIGIIAASNKKPTKRGNPYSGIIIDNRLNAQSIVFDYLTQNANGAVNAKNSNKINEHLRTVSRHIDINTLKSNVLLPLKRQGFIGSNSSGYFIISSESDLQSAFDYHLDKVSGIVKTLNIFAEKAGNKGNDKLKFQLNDYLKSLQT